MRYAVVMLVVGLVTSVGCGSDGPKPVRFEPPDSDTPAIVLVTFVTMAGSPGGTRVAVTRALSPWISSSSLPSRWKQGFSRVHGLFWTKTKILRRLSTLRYSTSIPRQSAVSGPMAAPTSARWMPGPMSGFVN